MYKLFLKLWINFFVQWSLNAQNAVRMWVTHPIFVVALCSNREYLVGGGGWVLGSSFLNSLHAHIRSGTKGASAIGPQLWGEVFSIGGRGPKSPISSGLFGPYAARHAFHKLPHGKGLNNLFIYALFPWEGSMGCTAPLASTLCGCPPLWWCPAASLAGIPWGS